MLPPLFPPPPYLYCVYVCVSRQSQGRGPGNKDRVTSRPSSSPRRRRTPITETTWVVSLAIRYVCTDDTCVCRIAAVGGYIGVEVDGG